MRAKLRKLETRNDLILMVNGRQMVHSFEFYKATGLKMTNYTRWLRETALDIGEFRKDYIPAPENVAGRTLRFRLRYYFDIEFAIALCLVVRRRESLELKDYLFENMIKKHK